MDKINLPKLSYKDLEWKQEDNVTIQSRANEFEQQNLRYIDAGYNCNNSMYYRAFEVGNDVHNLCQTLFPRYSVGIMKQPPGQTLPIHEDTFYQFASVHDVNPYDCCRINIFLEDWQSGHYFEINGKSVLHWKQGDVIIIQRDQLHLSGNMGMTTKYTMQVTGVKSEFKGC